MKYKLVNSEKITKDAFLRKYAVAHININNLEWTKVTLETAAETMTPVILGASVGAIKYMGGFITVRSMVENLVEYLKITTPVSLHLDHGDYESSIAAIKAGFTSVMFDGSKLKFADNYKKTKRICELARSKGISVEAEVGSIGGSEDGHTAEGELADLQEVEKITELPLFALAAGIGNVHGIYPDDWSGINLSHLKSINKIAKVPIVLHGGSGIPEDQIKKAIKLGVAKINVNTDLQIVFAQALRKYFEEKKDLNLDKKGYDPRKIFTYGMDAMRTKLKLIFKLLGCLGKSKK